MKPSQWERPRGRPRARSKRAGQSHSPPPRLTPDQAQVAAQIVAWLAQGERTVVLGGYVGTGKTFTVTALLRSYLNRYPLVVTAPTHKAVHVLRGMGLPENPPVLRYATIHSVLGLQPVYDVAMIIVWAIAAVAWMERSLRSAIQVPPGQNDDQGPTT